MALTHGCRTRRCLVSSERVMCSRTSSSDTQDATSPALCRPDSAAEHKTSRRQDVTPLFWWDGPGILPIKCSFTTYINKRQGSVWVINQAVSPACHMLSIIPQVQQIYPLDIKVSPLLLPIYVHPPKATGVCARKKEVGLSSWRLNFLGI